MSCFTQAARHFERTLFLIKLTSIAKYIRSRGREAALSRPFAPAGKNQHQLMPIIYLLVYTRTIEAGEKLAYYWFLVCSADLNL